MYVQHDSKWLDGISTLMGKMGGNQGLKHHTHYQFCCYLLRVTRERPKNTLKKIMVTYENCTHVRAYSA